MNIQEIIFYLKQFVHDSNCFSHFFHGTPDEVREAISSKKIKETALVLINLNASLLNKDNKKFVGTLAIIKPFRDTLKSDRNDDLNTTETIFWELMSPYFRSNCDWFSCFTGDLESICEEDYNGWQIDFESIQVSAPKCYSSDLIDNCPAGLNPSFVYTVNENTIEINVSETNYESAILCIVDACRRTTEKPLDQNDFQLPTKSQKNSCSFDRKEIMDELNTQNRNTREAEFILKAFCTDGNGKKWMREARAVIPNKIGTGASHFYCSEET